MAISFIYVLGYDGIMDDNSMIVVRGCNILILGKKPFWLSDWKFGYEILLFWLLIDLKIWQPCLYHKAAY